MVSMILAMDSQGGIGIDNSLPWHLPADLAHFKCKTLNSVVIMGRKTYESIGKPLPRRVNVVLTRDRDFTAEGVIVRHSPAKVIEEFGDNKLMVIGGANIYKVFMPFADKLIVTHVHHLFKADTFVDIDWNVWKAIHRIPGVVDDKNVYHHDFVTYRRQK